MAPVGKDGRRSWRSHNLGSAIVRSIIALACIGAVGFVLLVLTLNRSTGWGPRDVVIQKGMSVEQIGRLLHNEGVIRSPRLFILLSLVNRNSRNLKAGTHHFQEGMDTWEILEELTVSKAEFHEVTIPEGRTLLQTLTRLAATADLDERELRRIATDPGFCRRLGVDADNLEGYLFPETYRLSPTMDEEQVIRMLIGQFFAVFSGKLKERAQEIGMSVHEVVTLASIIEGEAQLEEERSTISAVYHNRLKHGMRLQADPTVQYAIEGGPRRLFYRDYRIDSPYNTYRHKGLPPGPVMNPGAASLAAALFPANVDYLYFVAKGDGSHVFSRTSREHDRAKHRTRWARRRNWQPSKTP